MLTPRFDDFIDYYINFGPVFDSMKDLVLFIGILILTILYQVKFIDTRIRRIILVALIAKVISSCMSLMIALKFTFGIHKFPFMCIKTFLFDSTFQTYNHLPISVVVAKLIPINVETSMFAILSGI